MRIVLIIQSMIILAGAYYIYTLMNPGSEDSDSNITIEVVDTPERESNESSDEAGDELPAMNSTSSVKTDLGGHNDAGMEFPTFDDAVSQ